MSRRHLVLALVLLAPLAAGQSGPAPAPSTQPAAPADALASLVDDLASTSFAAREAAQKALLATPLEQIERVRELAAGVTDPEAALRLKAILGTLETIEVTTTPGITLDVKNATLTDVAAALSKSAGVPVQADVSAAGGRFTLAVTDKPLWEIIDLLSKQHPLGLADRDGLTLKGAGTQSTRHRLINRGVLFSISDPKLAGFAGFGGRIRAIPSQFDLVVAVDPRINLFQAHPPIVTSAKDNLGHAVELAQEDEAGRQIINDPPRLWSRDIDLGVPLEIGDKLSVAGSVTFSAILPELPIEIAEPAKHLNEAIKVGGLTVTLRQILLTQNGPVKPGGVIPAIGIKFDVVPGFSTALPPEVGELTQIGDEIHAPSYGKRSLFPVKGVAGGTVNAGNDTMGITDGLVRYDVPLDRDLPSAPLELIATDAAGRKIMSAQLTVNSPCTVVRAVSTDFKEPIRLTLRTGRVREATVPFEFKDLSLQR